MVATIEATRLTNKEKEELLREILGKDYAVAGNNLPLLKELIGDVANIDSFFTIAEILPIFNKILSVRIFSVIASGASVISIFLIPVSALIDAINAYQVSKKMYSYRAIAYAITSWAFGKPPLSSSNRVMQQLTTGFPKVKSQEIMEYNSAWRKSSQDVVNKMELISRQNKIPKKALQIFLRAIAKNNEQKLCEILLKGFENNFDPVVRVSWKSNYSIRYPG